MAYFKVICFIWLGEMRKYTEVYLLRTRCIPLGEVRLHTPCYLLVSFYEETFVYCYSVVSTTEIV
jgi:hypothetical protein